MSEYNDKDMKPQMYNGLNDAYSESFELYMSDGRYTGVENGSNSMINANLNEASRPTYVSPPSNLMSASHASIQCSPFLNKSPSYPDNSNPYYQSQQTPMLQMQNHQDSQIPTQAVNYNSSIYYQASALPSHYATSDKYTATPNDATDDMSIPLPPPMMTGDSCVPPTSSYTLNASSPYMKSPQENLYNASYAVSSPTPSMQYPSMHTQESNLSPSMPFYSNLPAPSYSQSMSVSPTPPNGNANPSLSPYYSAPNSSADNLPSSAPYSSSMNTMSYLSEVPPQNMYNEMNNSNAYSMVQEPQGYSLQNTNYPFPSSASETSHLQSTVNTQLSEPPPTLPPSPQSDAPDSPAKNNCRYTYVSMVKRITDQIRANVAQAFPNDENAPSLSPILPSEPADSLYSLSLEELKTILQEAEIPTDDLFSVYLCVKRLKSFASILPTLCPSDLPEPPPDILPFRLTLLEDNSVPKTLTPEQCQQKAIEKMAKKPIQAPLVLSQNCTVLSFGTVDNRPNYSTMEVIYPVGYHARRQFSSIKDPTRDTFYDCSIEDGGEEGPLFKLSNEEENFSVSSSDINSVWNTLRNTVHDRKSELNIYKKKGCKPSLNVGEEYYGLLHKQVQLYLETQPKTLECPSYVFTAIRDMHGSVPEIRKRKLQSKQDRRTIDEMKASLAKKMLETAKVKLPKTTMDILTSKQKEFTRSQHILIRLILEELDRRDNEWNKINDRLLHAYCVKHKLKSSKKKTVNELKGTNSTAGTKYQTTTDSQEANNLSTAATKDTTMDSHVSLEGLPSTGFDGEESGAVENPLDKTVKKKRGRKAKDPSLSSVASLSPATLSELVKQAQLPSKNELDLKHLLICATGRNISRRDEEKEFNTNTPTPDVPPSLKAASLLPDKYVTEALSLWEFSVTFARVFSCTPFTFQEFEIGLISSTLFPAIEQLPTLILRILFLQLKSTLALDEREITVHGWRPFLGRHLDVYTWPEFARLLFVCYTWVGYGKDPYSVLRLFMEGGKRNIDALIIQDPVDEIMQKVTLEAKNNEIESIIGPLVPTDRILFERCFALLKRLKLEPEIGPFLEPVDTKSFPDYNSIVSNPICLNQVEQRLMSGQYCHDGHFDKETMYNDVNLIWSNCLLYNHSSSPLYASSNRFHCLFENLYQLWVLNCDTSRETRGPWSEVNFYNQGCKHCILAKSTSKDSQEEALNPHDGSIVECSNCKVQFHYQCVIPPLTTPPESAWLCGYCQGLNTQEMWTGELLDISGKSVATKNGSIANNETDPSKVHPSCIGHMPLKSLFSNTSGTNYDYLKSYDSTTISPVYFGKLQTSTYLDSDAEMKEKDPLTADLQNDLQAIEKDMDISLDVPLLPRVRRLAIILSKYDPNELPFKTRLCLFSALIEIAKDTPEVRRYIDDSMDRIAELKKEVNKEFSTEGHQVKERYNQIVLPVVTRSGKRMGRPKKATSESTAPTNENEGSLNEQSTSLKSTTDNKKASNKSTSDVASTANTSKSKTPLTESSQDLLMDPYGNEEATESKQTDNMEESKQEPSKSQEIEDKERSASVSSDKKKNANRNKSWSAEEVDVLNRAIEEFGEGKWSKIIKKYAAQLGNRSIPAIREKWRNLKSESEGMNNQLAADENSQLSKAEGSTAMKGRGRRKRDGTVSQNKYADPSAISSLLSYEFTLNLSEMLPYTIGGVTIFSLGTLKNNSKYASKQYVYPVGFKSRKVLYLYNKMYTFTNEIEDGGERGPIFSVTDDTGFKRSRYSSSLVWSEILLNIKNENHDLSLDTILQNVHLNISNEPDCDLLSLNIFKNIGPDFFGYGIPQVIHYYAQLPTISYYSQFVEKRKSTSTYISPYHVTFALFSAVHPSTIGYEFKTTNEEEEKQPETTFDPTVCSPIFFSNHYHKQDQTQLCDICHLPINNENSTSVEVILPDPSIYKESLKKDHVIPFLGLQRMDANGNTIATKLKMHEECSIIIQRVYVSQTKKNKYQELEFIEKLVRDRYTGALRECHVRNPPLGEDRFNREYYRYQGDPGRLYVFDSLKNEWTVCDNIDSLMELVLWLNPFFYPSEKHLYERIIDIMEEFKRDMDLLSKSPRIPLHPLTMKAYEETRSRIEKHYQLTKNPLVYKMMTMLQKPQQEIQPFAIQSTKSEYISIPYSNLIYAPRTLTPEIYSILPYHSIASDYLKFVVVDPFSESSMIKQENDSILVKQENDQKESPLTVSQLQRCSICGAYLEPDLYHCSSCHLNFKCQDERRFQQHEQDCRESKEAQSICQYSVDTIYGQHMQHIKCLLLDIETTLPSFVMTKKGLYSWTPSRRLMWRNKVCQASTASELYVCAILLEKLISKGWIHRWYRWCVPTLEVQSRIITPSSLSVRLQALDEAIRYKKVNSMERETVLNPVQSPLPDEMEDAGEEHESSDLMDEEENFDELFELGETLENPDAGEDEDMDIENINTQMDLSEDSPVKLTTQNDYSLPAVDEPTDSPSKSTKRSKSSSSTTRSPKKRKGHDPFYDSEDSYEYVPEEKDDDDYMLEDESESRDSDSELFYTKKENYTKSSRETRSMTRKETPSVSTRQWNKDSVHSGIVIHISTHDGYHIHKIEPSWLSTQITHSTKRPPPQDSASVPSPKKVKFSLTPKVQPPSAPAKEKPNMILKMKNTRPKKKLYISSSDDDSF